MAERELLPIVDVHCHPWRLDALLAHDPATFEDRSTMMGMCQLTSGTSAQLGEAVVRMTEATPLALTLRRRLAEWLGCAPDKQAVADARHRALHADPAGYLSGLMDHAGVCALLLDEGFPQPTIEVGPLVEQTGAVVHRVGRIEPWITELQSTTATYAELEDAFVARLDEEAQDPYLVAFKSVIAYRTGLDIGDPTPDEAQAGYDGWRRDGFAESRGRSKPVRDRLLRRLFERAEALDRPVHIHCGGGDPEVALAHARPAGLFDVISAYPRTAVVLIHSGWPWIEEAAFIASIIPSVHLDTSITTPWASLAIDSKLEVMLGAVPTSKVMYGSDEASEPEVIWLSAHVGREALDRVLGAAVARNWLTEAEAHTTLAGVLGDNALRLHGIRP